MTGIMLNIDRNNEYRVLLNVLNDEKLEHPGF